MPSIVHLETDREVGGVRTGGLWAHGFRVNAPNPSLYLVPEAALCSWVSLRSPGLKSWFYTEDLGHWLPHPGFL